jgi:NIMA (never in mitosis gene a)-related kinase
MASFESPFIVRFYEAICEQKRLNIVTEYARLGDLAHLIERRKRKHRPLQEDDIWRFLLQLLQGLKALHSCGVVHRDLKSANILMSGPDLLKIADLGVSTVLQSMQLARTQIGTPMYLAPEVWKKRPYDHRCDMWSLGVLLYELMTFSYPFHGRSTRDLCQRVCMGRYAPPTGYSSDLTSIVRWLLQVSPALRPSVNEVLEMQAVQSRMRLLSEFADILPRTPENQLLSPIRVPGNVQNLHFPLPAYNRKAEIVRPLDQRLHVKKGIPIRKDVNLISSPELQLIADFDWWSPNKEVVPNSPYTPLNLAEPQAIVPPAAPVQVFGPPIAPPQVLAPLIVPPQVLAAPIAPAQWVAPRPPPVVKPCAPAGPPVPQNGANLRLRRVVS